MSQPVVKIAIGLSLLCLLASIFFYVSSTDDDVKTLSVAPQSNTVVPAPQKRSSSKNHDADSSVASAEPLSSTDAPATSEEGEPDEAPTSAIIAGRVVSQGPLDDGTAVYLVQVKAFDPPPPEDEHDETTEADEPGEAVGTAPEEVVADAQADGGDEDAAEVAEADSDEGGFDGDYLEPLYPDENGEFETEVDPGEYKLIARAPGHKPTVIEGIVVHESEEVRGLVVELEQGLSIAGYVRVESSAAPTDFADMEISLEGNGYAMRAFPDENGNFSFDGLAPGEYAVHTLDSELGSAAAKVRAGDKSVALNLRMNHIEGTVLDAHGVPVHFASVSATASYKLPPEVDRDPFGSVDGSPEVGDADAEARDSQFADTDENGHFVIDIASRDNVTLIAMGDDQSMAVARDVNPGSNVRLTLRPPPEIKFIGTAKDNTVPRYVSVLPDDDDFADLPVQTHEATGEMSFSIPAEGNWILSVDPGVELSELPTLPPNLKIERQVEDSDEPVRRISVAKTIDLEQGSWDNLPDAQPEPMPQVVY